MADNKKYYYMRLKENFFESDEMIMLESLPNGYQYQNILLKLYLRSLKNEGRLSFKPLIPYTPEMLAVALRMEVGTVKEALRLFEDLGLIEKLDSGVIYMADIQEFIGQSSTEADRIKKYRNKIQREKEKSIGSKEPHKGISNSNGQMSVQMYTKDKYKSTPELEKELDIEQEPLPLVPTDKTEVSDIEQASPFKTSSSGRGSFTNSNVPSPLQQVTQFYGANNFEMTNAIIQQDISYMFEDLTKLNNGDEQAAANLMLYALKQAALNNVLKWSYAKRILDRHIKAHHTTVEQAEKADQDYKRQHEPRTRNFGQPTVEEKFKAKSVYEIMGIPDPNQQGGK